MPIIAESPPLALNIGEPTTPEPTPTQAPVTPTPIVTPNNVLERHRQFIRQIDAAKTCFTEEALAGFKDEEFTLHLEIAKVDKYIVDAGNGNYCSKAAVSSLSKALERQTV